MRVDARDLSLVVGSGDKQKTILHSVSFSIAPREFVAIVGGSGAGKSTLMRAINGSVRTIGGQVLVNGDDLYQHFDAYRALLGYVPQDDILHRTLQVDRALGYVARLRLSPDSDDVKIRQRVEQALADVEMLPHRAKNVEQLSGGQRKRVSIAAELLADPSLFFLDEPTSGLDPGLEKKMMHTLRHLADSGRTVMLVTHATENIALCDHVIFMASGRMVFFGPPADALSFFGLIFRLAPDSIPEVISRLMVSRWAVDALGTSVNINRFCNLPNGSPLAQNCNPPLADLFPDAFIRSPEHLRYTWLILLLFVVGGIAITTLLLKLKDRRS
jgi:ABC-type multidrug transport system ATPase subunit